MKKKSLLLTAVATLGLTAATMAQNVPNYVPTNGLVGWWPFNGNANDESGNGNNGTVNGATLTTDRFGIAGKAYDFDGVNKKITVNDNNNLSFTNSILSYSFWAYIRPNNTASAGILCKYNITSDFEYNATVNPTNIAFIIQNLAGSCAVQANYVAYSPNLENNWHHFVFTSDFISGSKVFVDGVLVSTQPTGLSCIQGNGAGKLYFGMGGGWNQEFYFSGLIDDIGTWNRALTQQEITDLYNGNICYQTITVTDTLLINMGITGFNPVTYNNTIKIFPNPTNDHITINYGNFASLNGYQIKIENSLGQQVFQTNITQQSDYLNLTTWGGNGLYFVRIIDPQQNTIDIKKIVLQ